MRWIVPLLVTLILHPVVAWSAVDSDGDGVTDYREQRDGTDPNDAVSFRPLSKGLVAHYPFDQGLLDESGFAKHLDQTFSYELVGDLTSGSGQAFRLPSSASAGAASTLNSGVGGNMPRTVSFWFYSDRPHPWPTGAALRLAGNVIVIDGGRGVIAVDNNYHNVETPFVPQLHQRLLHFVWTYEERLGNSKLYLNGQRVETVFPAGFGNPDQTLSSARPDSTVALGGSTGFQGRLDDIRLYSRVLTSEEVAELYRQEGSPTPPADAVTIAAGVVTKAAFDVIQGAFTWQQARADALARGGRLAILPTGEMYDRVISEVRQTYSGNLWIGLTDEVQEGVWRWIDGTSLAYSRWHGGEPSNGGGVEDYVHVWDADRKTWNDNAASASMPYLLERQVSALAASLLSEGGQAWTVDTTQTHDGVSSAKAQTTDGQSTYREYMITGPAVVDFWWKVSSEKNFDTFSYSLNGVNQETISGEVDWTYRTLTLPAGTHTIRWTYSKDDSGAIGQDAGWLDEFAVYPATATLRVRDGATLLDSRHTVDFGSTALQGSSPTKSLTFSNEGYVPLEVQLSLPAGSPFTFEGGMLSYELLLARGESMEVPISLATDSAGTKTAIMSIEATDSDVAPPIIALQGILLGQRISVGQGGNALTSGQSINMGLAPRTLHFTISNTGNVGDLIISQISSTGNFQITQQPQTTIAPQSSTSFTVLAQAVAFGSQTGGITITSNDPDTPAFTIPLSATAFAVGGDGIRNDSMATSGSGGAVGWGFASTQLPGGATGQALKTGNTPNNGGSVLEFTSQTAGVVTWSWKVSTQEEFDWLLCEVDGQETAGISTKNGFWQTQVVNVPAGANVRWVYRKDGSGSIGEDAGYLADVEFRSFAANQSFGQWAQIHGIYDAQQRLPKSGLQAMFGWLGGFGADGERDDDTHKEWILGGRLTYRYPISKAADGTQQILYSSDTSSWTTRRFSQRIVSEDADRVVIEATAPSGTKGFFKVVASRYTPTIMTAVQGGALPQSSPLVGAVVAPFKIGKFEVTWDEWQDLRAWAINNGYSDLVGVGEGSAGNHPVRDVNWFDVLKWCNAKSEKEGLDPVYHLDGDVYRAGENIPTLDSSANGYRLPTESEWEWAARGGVESQGFIYSGGNDVNVVAYYFENSGGAAIALREGRGTWPVGQKAANELEIHDMSGNIAEWVFTAFETSRIFKGGSWGYPNADGCSVAFRNGNWIYPSFRGDDIGFRVARNAED